MNKVKHTVTNDRKPNPVDTHVGARLRMRRTLMGFSQEKLADSVGLTFQQVQKYERGTNRISASRLYQFSKVLDVPISFFYDNYSENTSAENGEDQSSTNGLSDNQQENFTLDDEIMEKKETLELIRVYYSLRDPSLRRDLLRMIKTLASNISAENHQDDDE